MSETIIIALTGFGIAFFHAAIPTHWLPFVITAGAQRWSRNKALMVTALAGTGHVLFTAFLGVLIAWFGIEVHQRIGSWFPWIEGGALLLFGLFYIVRQLTGTGHGHSHIFGGHSHHGTTPRLHTHSHINSSPAWGSHGGKLIDTGNGVVEVAIFQENDEARFRLYPIDSDGERGVTPANGSATMETVRPNHQQQRFSFADGGGYMVSNEIIAKPYQFTAILSLAHGDHTHSYETRFQDPTEDDRQSETIDIVTSGSRVSDRVAITSLLALLTFSPCESFLPVYVSGVRYGWMGFVLLTAVLSIATVAGMVLFTSLTLIKLERLNLRFLEKYESVIIGGLLCTLGLLIILIEK